MIKNNSKHKLIKKIIFSSEKIQDGIYKLAEKLNQEYKNIKKPILLLGILKGCGPFMFELIKHLTFDFKIDFIVISSYFGGIKPKTNNPKIILDIDCSVEGYHVIIVEDIVETGNTITNIKKHLINKNTESIKTVSLLYKKTDKTITKPDWYIFDAPNKFLVGFGLDYNEKLRNLSYIGIFKKDK